jgi:hypothetical protein
MRSDMHTEDPRPLPDWWQQQCGEWITIAGTSSDGVLVNFVGETVVVVLNGAIYTGVCEVLRSDLLALVRDSSWRDYDGRFGAHADAGPVVARLLRGFDIRAARERDGTALIPISPLPSGYLDISLVATQGSVTLPVESAYYNVLVYSPATPPNPDGYQAIAPELTSLYLQLPAPPKTNAIGLSIPSDGSAPAFGDERLIFRRQ